MAEREAAAVAVQIALIDALAGIGRTVYSVVPQAPDGGAVAPFPYIHVDEPLFGAWDTDTWNGHAILQRIHVRDRAGTNLTVKRLQAEIYGLLHHSILALTDWRMILMQQEQAFVTRMPDGSFDGVSEFQILIQDA